ncbi:MAG TPA: Fe(3+) ABC transporter substrate-binding protein [Alphaproteobacteria bacterium]
MRFGRFGLAALTGAVAAFAAALAPAAAQEVNVYSSRHYPSDQKLIELFQQKTGIKVNMIEAEIGPLLQRLRSEGRNSPADVLITVDAGNLWRAQEAGLFQPVKSAALDEVVPANLREPSGLWFGLSQRARVIIYNKEKVKPSELSTYEDLADPKWKGRILIRSSNNVYNQSLLASMIAAHGAAKAEEWARGIVANMARPPKGGDTDQIKAVAAGEGDIAIANTYYFARLVASDKPEDKAVVAKLGIFFPNQKDRGTHVNISGAGVTRYAPNRDNAIKFLEFLVTPEAQEIFAHANHEYPVRAGVAPTAVVQSWGTFKADPLNAAELGRHQAEAVRIFDRVGWR